MDSPAAYLFEDKRHSEPSLSRFLDPFNGHLGILNPKTYVGILKMLITYAVAGDQT